MKIDMAEGIGIQFCGGMSPSPDIVNRLLAVLNASPEVDMASYSVIFRSTGADRRILVYPAEKGGKKNGKQNKSKKAAG